MPEKGIDHKNLNRKREQQFVLDVLRCFIKRENKGLLIPKYLDWAWINDIVFNHNLGPIFKHTLAGYDVPTFLSTQWHQEQLITFVRNTRALVSAIKLFRIMDAAAIPAAVIRGISLSNHIYPGDCLSLRPMCDVDMLIRPYDRENVKRALDAEGIHITKRLRSQLVYRVNDIAFEIHWSLLTPKRYRFAVDSEVFLETRQRIDLPEGRIYCLSYEYELIGLVVHAFIHHELKGILALVDMAILIEHYKLDWQFIAEWCKKARLSRMFAFTLSLADYLFGLNLEEKLSLFGQFSLNENMTFEAYARRFFDGDSLGCYLRRKRNLFLVAERPLIKLKQTCRLFAIDELCEFVRILRQTIYR